MSLRQFLDIALHEAAPDHSTVSRTRRRIDLETHQAVFTWVLQHLADAGLVRGQTVGIDATTLDANAALRSIVRRDTGEGYETFLRGLAEASGVSTPTRAELARFDRKRPEEGVQTTICTHLQDTEAKITRMEDGRTGWRTRNRAIAPRPSARALQRAQATARARLWGQSGSAHAGSDGRRNAAHPPGPGYSTPFDALIRALSRRWHLVALSGAARPFDPRDLSWIAPAAQRYQLVPLTL